MILDKLIVGPFSRVNLSLSLRVVLIVSHFMFGGSGKDGESLPAGRSDTIQDTTKNKVVT